MNSTEDSKTLLKVSNLRIHFELDFYNTTGLRDVFVQAMKHPMEYLFKQSEIFYVIDDISFEIQKGMRLGILGTNGCGKTTLCRCIAGMMKAHQGTIETQAEIRAIFDTGSGIMPELTGRENAMLLARLFFPREPDIKSLVNEAIEFSELGQFIDVPFKQYSKGMQARLLLSLISSKATDILILDEVLDGADIFFQKKLSIRMKDFIQKSGATIFVSHSADQIRQVCNKVMVLKDGKIQFFGEVEEGIQKYVEINS